MSDSIQVVHCGLLPYAAAYEHGLLFVPESAGGVVDAQGETVAHSIVALETRKNAAKGLRDTPLTELSTHVEYVDKLAIDVASHVADARLRVTEAIEIDPDGSVWLVPWQQAIPYWVRKGDLGDEQRAVLDGLQINWIDEDDEADASASV